MMTKTHSISSLYLDKLLEVLQQLGINSHPVCRAAEIPPGSTSCPGPQVGLSQYLAGVKAALALPVPPDLGFLVGDQTHVLEHGVLGYAMVSSKSLEQSLERCLRYQRLHTPLLRVSLFSENSRATLHVRPGDTSRQLTPRVYEYLVQQWLGGWKDWARLVGEHTGFFSAVRLAYFAPSESVATYRQHLNCDVEFGCGRTAAVFPREWLTRELDFSNESVGQLCADQYRQVIRSVAEPDEFQARLHRLLAAHPGSIAGMEAMAARLNMSARTLRRRLAQEGTTYQQVVIDFRMAMAQRYLRETQLPANEIANLVGYSDTTNFYRTFRSVQGVTPRAYRLAANRQVATPEFVPGLPLLGLLPTPGC